MKKRQTDPDETNNLNQKAEDVLRQLNIGLEKLTRFYMESSKLLDGNDLEQFICMQIKDIAEAEVAVFSGYDYASSSTRVVHIEIEPGLLEKVVGLLGKELKKMSFVVNEEMFQAMTTTSIAEIKTLHEVSFGAISPPISAAIQALVKVNRFIALSFTLDGRLYGTTMLAMSSSKPNPPRVILEQFINMAALALQRKLAEKALRESEERFKALHNASFGGIAIHDQGVILDCNQGLTDMTGYPREELIGMNGFLLIAPEFRQLVLDNISEKYEKPYEAMGLRKNVETFPMRLEARNIPYKGKSVRTVEFRDLTEQKLAEEELKKIAWMLSEKPSELNPQLSSYPLEDQGYGDLTALNHGGLIYSSIDKAMLRDITAEYLNLLDTSSAIYEKNGDYAYGIFCSGWCRMMDRASRNLCQTESNEEALANGKWLCHESCWNECSKRAIETGAPVDIECAGGIHLYAVPIFSSGEIIGAINFGYGEPPKDHKKLRLLADTYGLDPDQLKHEAEAYAARPVYIIELAKQRLLSSARLIGIMVEGKQAEKRLRKSEKDLIEAQRIARLGSWYLDIATNDVKWSEELYKMYNYDPSLPPPPYTEHHKLFTEESWQILSTALANTAENGVPYELELNTVLPDGTNGWLWVFGQTVKDENGVVIGISGAAQDITERKKAEYEKDILTNQLNQAQKMDLLGQLAGGVAHDFNNLLTVIMGYSAELSNSPRLDSMDRQEAEEIYKAGARAKRLTQQLLSFSRKQVVQATVLDLNELIANLQVVFDRLIGAHIKIIFQASSDSAMVKVDRVQIEQTIINLVLNSRDAMPLGGTVTIKTFVIWQSTSDIESLFQVKPGKYVLLSVTDTGCGIPKEIQDTIFEPFFTTKEKGKGLGLGLSNVSNIIKSSRGSISFESSPEAGTTFKILLPYTSEQVVLDDIDLLEKDLNGNGEQILIVDDEETLTDYFQKKLARIGYNVAVANSGAEALMLLEKGLHPDLVITDIIMPRMNGKELVDRILQETPEQKVLFMSGFTDDIIHPLGVNGSIPYIQKPCSLSELALTIKSILPSDNVSNATMGSTPQDRFDSKVRILMLDDDADLLHLIQRTCNKIGQGFFGAQNLTDALTEMDKSPYDILLIDDNLGAMTGAEALSKIRAKGHKMPAIGISGSLNADRIRSMEDAGMITVIEKSCDFHAMIDAALCAAKLHH